MKTYGLLSSCGDSKNGKNSAVKLGPLKVN